MAKPRNRIAKRLAEPRFKQRVVRLKTGYTRKPRTRIQRQLDIADA